MILGGTRRGHFVRKTLISGLSALVMVAVLVLGCSSDPEGELSVLPSKAWLVGHQNVNKVTKLEFMASGQGCDLDGDGEIDNNYGKVLGVYPKINDLIQEEIKKNALVWLLIPDTWRVDGGVMTLYSVRGDLAENSATCDGVNPSGCSYTVNTSNFDPPAETPRTKPQTIDSVGHA